MRLENKVAVITGASRGIGLEIAKGFAQEGAKVVLASRKQEGLDAAAKEITEAGGTALPLATHTGDPDQCQNLIEKTISEFGRVDILVNNAATNVHFGPMITAEQSQLQKIFEVNVFGYFWMSKFAAEAMQNSGGGKIINMASVAGIRPGTMMGVYSCSKASIIMMTKVMAHELAGDNIQVNAIAPGVIKTRFARALWDNEEIYDHLINRTPAARIGEPEEVTQAALYLASPGSEFTTGSVLVIDGGVSIVSM